MPVSVEMYGGDGGGGGAGGRAAGEGMEGVGPLKPMPEALKQDGALEYWPATTVCHCGWFVTAVVM
jgi:hypothetical protein